jgi:hypothetical protein
MAPFEREARILASLSHPNIASIHGLEESNGTRAPVMELVEGPTLADRIKAGPIPIDEALSIAKQIAEALEYASSVMPSAVKKAIAAARSSTTTLTSNTRHTPSLRGSCFSSGESESGDVIK